MPASTRRSSWAEMEAPLLDVRDLVVSYGAAGRERRVVDQASLAVAPGESVGIVGESGCGKSQTMLAVQRLLPPGGRIAAARMSFAGLDLATLDAESMRRLRGTGIAYVSQDALSALNPVMTVSRQLAEPLIVEHGMGAAAARIRCLELLEQVGIPAAEARLASYPHQLSGGMRQRVLIAMAISCRPRLLIADEPTTALDVTVQAQIIELLDRLRRELEMALILISHDLGLVAGVTDRVAIMYAGKIVETASTAEVFARPAHPYTQALLAAIPRLDTSLGERLSPIPGLPPDAAHRPPGCSFQPRCTRAAARCAVDRPELKPIDGAGHLARCWIPGEPLPGSHVSTSAPSLAPAESAREAAAKIAVHQIRVHFPVRRGILRRASGVVRAVDGVSFEIARGTTVGLVGESGSGKSTTGRALLGLAPLSAGRVDMFGVDIATLARSHDGLPRVGQLVFQDPYASLNPRMTVGETLREVLEVHRIVPSGGATPRVRDLLDAVGLGTRVATQHPHRLSGGQRQRVAIARALAIEPQFVVCDEVVSALDVSIQGQIINLLQDLQRWKGLTYLFISHDLSVVRHISDRVVVMYGGKVIENASRAQLFDAPRHPYTHALLSAVPIPDPHVERRRRRGTARLDSPDPTVATQGCRYQRSCPFATSECSRDEPPLADAGRGHEVACHHWRSDAVRAALSNMGWKAAVA
ncbi:MAG: ABC transporter ATP-binding protein [Alphaproteobacteria bacterium]|nr:ABC transporter ATP-binding protein [Alphaproteobacteria bacterium]